LIETWNPNDVGTHTYFDSLNRPVVTRTGLQRDPVTLVVSGTGAVPGPNNSDAFITVKTYYDADGLVTSQVDDRGKTSTTAYDWAGRKTTFTYQDQSHENLYYLKEGTLSYEERYGTSSNRLFKVEYGYDSALRKTSSTFTLDAGSNLSGVTYESFAY